MSDAAGAGTPPVTGDPSTTTDTTTTSTTTTPPTEPATDWKAEAERYKAEARKQETRAKANAEAAKELARVRSSSMSDQEKAVEEARQAARQEILNELGADLVDSAIKLAVGDRLADVDALLEGLDRSKFLGEDHRPDAKKIAAWVDRLAPADGKARQTSTPDLAQGARGQAPALNTATATGRELLTAAFETDIHRK
jgi:hypothetical protein